MKLFLASLGITAGLLPHLEELFKGIERPLRTLIIPNASDYKDIQQQALLAPYNHLFQLPTFDYSYLDLRNYVGDRPALQRLLDKTDFLWVPGGNTFLLRYYCELVPLKPLLTAFLKRGGVYGGGSAGAIILGPTIQDFELSDPPEQAPQRINTGLGIVDFTIVPHQDSSEPYRRIHARTKDHPGYIALNDSQAVIVNGIQRTIVTAQ